MAANSSKLTETSMLSTGKPADFSFRSLKSINVSNFLETIGLEGARYTRVAGVPERGGEGKKFLTKSLWLNNNKLRNFKHVDELVEAVLEYPQELGWIDFSFNYITEIDEIANLDFSPVVHNEKLYPKPAEILKKLKDNKI
nr:unnamed protein product [Callosobruchus analis]